MVLNHVDCKLSNLGLKGGLVFRITKLKKKSVPLKTVYSNITIDGLRLFKLKVVVIEIKMK